MSPEQEMQMEDEDDGGSFIPIEDTYRVGDHPVPPWVHDAIAKLIILHRPDHCMVYVRGHFMYAPPMTVIAKAGSHLTLFETEIPQ